MAKKIILALALAVCASAPALAQNDTPGYGFNTKGQVVTNDMPFITVSNQSSMSDERALAVGSGLSLTDNGANSSISIGLGSVLSYFHGTGATTQQTAANAILNFPGVTSQDIIKFNGANWVLLPKGSTGQVLGIDGSGNLSYISPAGSGTVTSVDVTVPTWLTVTGGPVTGSGTFAITAAGGQAANRVLATPDGATGAVSLRALTATDIPSLDAAKITTGNLAKAQSATAGVYNDQSNTYSGTFTQDFSASGQTLRVPLKTDPGSPAAGEIWVNAGAVKVRDNASVTQTMVPSTRTITAGTGLTGGGDLSANRTLTAANTATTGYTGQTTYATGDMLYASATNTLAKRTIGSTGQVLTVSGGVPTWATPGAGFAGDGSDGAVTKGAVTETAIIQVNATTFSQTVSTTWSPFSRTAVLATSTCDFNGTTTVANGIAGGSASTERWVASGSGVSFGTGGVPGGGAGGGGGGGFGGAGGGGGNNGGPSTAQGYGGVGGAANDFAMDGPSSGGAGGFSTTSGAGGAGGAAGGSLLVEATGALTVGASGTINANGAAGSAGTTAGGGGGGGSGGYIGLFSKTSITLSTGANVNATGGAGGNGVAATSGKGGGGGGGRVVRMAPTITGAGTVTVTGGAAAGTGTGTAAAGSTGVNLSITDTPSRSIACEFQKDHIDLLYKWHTAFGHIKEGEELRLNSARPAAVWCAQFYPVEKREALVNEFLFGEDLSGGKTATIEKREDLKDAA